MRTSAGRLIIVTPGDPEGIGPEITWKAARAGAFDRPGFIFLCVGARKPFDELGAPVIEADEETLLSGSFDPIPKKMRRSAVWLLPAPTSAGRLENGKRRFLPGYQSGWAVEKAAHLIQASVAEAFVTGPISKERLQKGGYPYSGHTDFLADLCDAGDVTMMLANETLRISLVTCHIALKDVHAALTREKLRRAILHTAEHLRQWWGIRKPRIAVAALNPHAGESGLFGDEEKLVIEPELRTLRGRSQGRYELFGPFPADTLFARHIMAPLRERFDAIVCMYHDQGLIPVKLVDFPKTVNVTLGLPIIRTSVDHGTGFDIVGTGKADSSSLQAAIELATQIVTKRISPNRKFLAARTVKERRAP